MFYKSTNPDVIAAFNEYEAQKNVIKAEASKFAAAMNGVAVYQKEVDGFNFAGLRFHPPKDGLLWIKATEQTHYMQWPRSILRKGTKEQRQELKELNQKWEDAYPKTRRTRADKLFDLIHLNAGIFFFGGSILYFVHDGVFWMESSVAPNSDLITEILGSEYYVALEAAREADRQAEAAK